MKTDTSFALKAYFKDSISYCEPYGNGHINDTFLVVCNKRYILQRMNTNIFKDVSGLMKNILTVTNHIRNKAIANGGDEARCTLLVVPTLSGEMYYTDPLGQSWRLYEFTEGTVTREAVENPNDFYSCGYAFGQFGQLLSDMDATLLTETLPNFHNTPVRFENLLKSIEKDACGRRNEVENEIEFAMARKEFCNLFENARNQGKLPLKVTHNDTKLNNILFDKESGEAICVIDLDTVMPGYVLCDFGDSIRFGANTASEDETDLSKVKFDISLFETYARGFIKGCAGSLNETELELLPEGAIMMTLECGLRFLTDYLDGDVYFKTHRPKHNLDRARNQFALVQCMENALPQMKEIIKGIK